MKKSIIILSVIALVSCKKTDSKPTIIGPVNPDPVYYGKVQFWSKKQATIDVIVDGFYVPGTSGNKPDCQAGNSVSIKTGVKSYTAKIKTYSISGVDSTIVNGTVNVVANECNSIEL